MGQAKGEAKGRRGKAREYVENVGKSDAQAFCRRREIRNGAQLLVVAGESRTRLNCGSTTGRCRGIRAKLKRLVVAGE